MLLRYSGFGIEVYVVVISRNRRTILTPLEKKNSEITINILIITITTQIQPKNT